MLFVATPVSVCTEKLASLLQLPNILLSNASNSLKSCHLGRPVRRKMHDLLLSSASSQHCGVQEVAHRRPYEVLMLLQPIDAPRQQPQNSCALHVTGTALAARPADMSGGEEKAQPAFHAIFQPPDGLVMIAVPGEHSRKPQLAQLLQPYLPEKAGCLEVCLTIQWCFRSNVGSTSRRPSLCSLQMFARELIAGWTSWGNQVLHFQQKHLFEPRPLHSIS